MKFIYKSLLVVALLFSFSEASASHLLGGEITWQCEADGDYTFVLKVYRDCGTNSIPLTANSQTINISGAGAPSSFSVTRVSITDISPSCYNAAINCNQVPSGKGAIEEHVYVKTDVKLSGAPPLNGWTFWWYDCCRPPSVQNVAGASGTGYTVRAIMYPYTPPGNVGNNFRPVNKCFDNNKYPS
ncbi:MAG: hypothetical protein ACPF9D_14255 [Owenweeksia sp.]